MLKLSSVLLQSVDFLLKFESPNNTILHALKILGTKYNEICR